MEPGRGRMRAHCRRPDPDTRLRRHRPEGQRSRVRFRPNRMKPTGSRVSQTHPRRSSRKPYLWPRALPHHHRSGWERGRPRPAGCREIGLRSMKLCSLRLTVPIGSVLSASVGAWHQPTYVGIVTIQPLFGRTRNIGRAGTSQVRVETSYGTAPEPNRHVPGILGMVHGHFHTTRSPRAGSGHPYG